MKKLMIAFAAVAMAVCANAATYNWKSISGYVYGTDGQTKVDGTAYLFNADAFSQTALLTALYDAKASDAGALATTFATIANQSAITHQDMSAGRVALGASFDYNGVAAGNSWTAYYAMIIGDDIYISSEKTGIQVTALPDAIGITMGTQSTVSKNVFDEFGTTYAGAGWYNAVAVPEPTSALMLLVGLAGLALKRKVA